MLLHRAAAEAEWLNPAAEPPSTTAVTRCPYSPPMSTASHTAAFSIATWNVERPKPTGWKIPPAQVRRMAAVDADVWVLTETHRNCERSLKVAICYQ